MDIVGQHEGVEFSEGFEAVKNGNISWEIFRTVPVYKGEVHVKVVDDDKIELLQTFEVLPVQLAHFPHGLDGDLLSIGTVDLPEEYSHFLNIGQGPLHKLVIRVINLVILHGVIILEEDGQFLPDNFQYVMG